MNIYSFICTHMPVPVPVQAHVHAHTYIRTHIRNYICTHIVYIRSVIVSVNLGHLVVAMLRHLVASVRITDEQQGARKKVTSARLRLRTWRLLGLVFHHRS